MCDEHVTSKLLERSEKADRILEGLVKQLSDNATVLAEVKSEVKAIDTRLSERGKTWEQQLAGHEQEIKSVRQKIESDHEKHENSLKEVYAKIEKGHKKINKKINKQCGPLNEAINHLKNKMYIITFCITIIVALFKFGAPYLIGYFTK